jgi:hypothetical protein
MKRFPSVERFGLSLLLALGLPACQDDATSSPLILDATDTQPADTATTQDTSTTTIEDTGATTSQDTDPTTAQDTGTTQDTQQDTAQDTQGADTAQDTQQDTGDVINPSRCGASTPLLIAGQETGFARCESGAVHRVAAKACADLTPRSGRCGEESNPGECTTDADCPGQSTCEESDWLRGQCYCNPGCVTDDDCGPGQLCHCGDPIGRCVAADCTTDADCGPGLLCVLQSDCYDQGSFTCQTPADECDDQSDCGPSDPWSGPFCQKQWGAGPLTCHSPGCAIPGRPFLVDEGARLAPVAARGDWQAEGLAPAHLEGLTVAQRQALSDHWARVGLMEHASVAAFARSAMQLMALGAPPALLIDTQAAMADELRHAQAAFALASAYAGAPVGPGPLAVDGALAQVDLQALLHMTVEEGCVGEAVAAVEAAEAAARAQDPVVKAVLEGIAQDEAAHAALAWRTVQWALGVGGAQAREVTKRLLAEAVARAGAPQAVAAADDASARLGVVEGSLAAELRRQALRYAVAPCAARLLGRSTLDDAPRKTQPHLIDVSSARAG